MTRIAIIGSGITGLTCARALVQAGLAPVLLDKGRGVGGRLATRRADGGLQFDHGATVLSARDAAFAALLADAEGAGAAARWQGGHVGLPGMSGLARHLARGVDLRQGVTVTGLSVDARGCTVSTDTEAMAFDRVVLTLPAPQALRLLGPDHALAKALSTVRMAPCLTLMAAFGAACDAPDVSAHDDPDAPFARILRDSAKPGRGAGGEAWVAQAGASLSRRHLERDMAEVTAILLPLLAARIGQDGQDARHAVSHRWRFALTETPLGDAFLADASGRLVLGGDWCLGASAEDGWRSGTALAAHLLATL